MWLGVRNDFRNWLHSFAPTWQAGFDQFARGEARTYDKTSGRQLAERIKSRGRAARAKKR
jgi:hypothetical protein